MLNVFSAVLDSKKTSVTPHTIPVYKPVPDKVFFYYNSLSDYYNTALKPYNRDYMEKLIKIPNSWSDGDQSKIAGIDISVEQMKKLGDLKKEKSAQLKFEEAHINELLNAELAIIAAMNYSDIGKEEITSGIQSLSKLNSSFKNDPNAFKNFLLTVSKHGVSDLFYLMNAYWIFTKKGNFDLYHHFDKFCTDASSILKSFISDLENIAQYKRYRESIDKYFYKTGSDFKWKLDDLAIKNYYESRGEEKILSAVVLKHIVDKTSSMMKRMKKYNQFIYFYYYDTSGKMFRVNYVKRHLADKVRNGRFPAQVIKSFNTTAVAFYDMKNDFDKKGISKFGWESCTYKNLAEFIYKCGKLMEHGYLHSSRYELLQSLRTDLLLTIEKELYTLR
jgi:hypothetical protein